MQFSKGTLRHMKILEKGPSQGVIQRSDPHERSPHAPKFEDGTQEETLQKKRCARRDAWEISPKRRTKPRSIGLQKFGHYQRHLRRSPRKDLCGGLQSFSAHDEQERSELSETEHHSGIQNHHNSCYSRWRSANERGSNSVRLRSRLIRDSTGPQRYASGSIAWKALRRSRILL